MHRPAEESDILTNPAGNRQNNIIYLFIYYAPIIKNEERPKLVRLQEIVRQRMTNES